MECQHHIRLACYFFFLSTSIVYFRKTGILVEWMKFPLATIRPAWTWRVTIVELWRTAQRKWRSTSRQSTSAGCLFNALSVWQQGRPMLRWGNIFTLHIRRRWIRCCFLHFPSKPVSFQFIYVDDMASKRQLQVMMDRAIHSSITRKMSRFPNSNPSITPDSGYLSINQDTDKVEVRLTVFIFT